MGVHHVAALNARNFFAAESSPLTFNQLGANLGGPLVNDRIFFFASYEATRNAVARALSFQVETPELREHVLGAQSGSVAARVFREFPAREFPSP